MLLDVIARTWGYNTFRPLQEEAMNAVLAGRDSLVVMPTGGGKSLCFQAPALIKDGLTVVVSPLISLMKDQVDALAANGAPAALMNSSQTAGERRDVSRDISRGAIKLLFVSPERLAIADFRKFLRDAGVSTFAIDEAHCISHWGHDFRPEYRQLQMLREEFEQASVHAYTATATPQVRRDIVQQLSLREPLVLVGDFDRPNLTYRVLPKQDEMSQIVEVLERHRDESGIVYCIRRKDVDSLTQQLAKRGYRAIAYHAGMSADERREAHDAFSREACDVIVATVAFGMGIDRSNVRYVIHTAMPKSIEHFQQETGRAGRDGLAAECVTLYSAADAAAWRSMLTNSEEGRIDPAWTDSALRHLYDLDRMLSGTTCRHRALVEYFGQTYRPPAEAARDPRHVADVPYGAGLPSSRHVADVPYGTGVPESRHVADVPYGAGVPESRHGAGVPESRHVADLPYGTGVPESRHVADVPYGAGVPESRHVADVPYGCSACDICLGETEDVADALTVAQKILSCVYRLEQSWGIGHVIAVLRGETNDRIQQRGHDRLSTYGILRESSRNELRDLIWQLIGQGFLRQTDDQYPIVKLTETSRSLLRGEGTVRLRKPIAVEKKSKKRRRESRAPLDADAALFEQLRRWRRSVAEERGVPPYVIFSDRTLQEIAAAVPSTLLELREIYGIGDAKLEAFGDDVLRVLRESRSHAER